MSGRSRRGRGAKGPPPGDAGAGEDGAPPASVRPSDDYGLGLVLRDVQTPLAALELNLMLLSGDLSSASPEAAVTLRDAQSAARRIREYVDHFVASRVFGEVAMRKRRRRVDLSALLRRLVAEYADAARAQGVKLELDLPAEPVVCARGDGVLLERVFQNLLERTLETPASGGRALIQARRGSVAEVCFVRSAEVSATGAPDATALPTVGLRGCIQAIEAHGGSLAVEGTPDPGMRLRVRLPTAQL